MSIVLFLPLSNRYYGMTLAIVRSKTLEVQYVILRKFGHLALANNLNIT